MTKKKRLVSSSYLIAVISTCCIAVTDNKVFFKPISVLQIGVLKSLVFLKDFLWLDLGGKSSASLEFLSLTILLNSLRDKSSRLTLLYILNQLGRQFA
jgi:hypothetical protein